MLKTTLEQLGNFYGFIVPKDLLETLDFNLNDNYELHVDENKLIIMKEGEFFETHADLSDEDLDAFSACLEDL